MRGQTATVLIWMLLVPSAGKAADCAIEAGSSARVASIADGETVLLDDGTLVRLVGALTPATPSWWKKPDSWRAAEAAKAALRVLVEGQTVQLKYSGEKADRRERVLAQLYVERDGGRVWVQEALIT